MQHDRGGPIGLYGCHGMTTQRWRLMDNGVISNGVACLRWDAFGIRACHEASTWVAVDGTLRPQGYDRTCLTRMPGKTDARLQSCSSDLKVKDKSGSKRKKKEGLSVSVCMCICAFVCVCVRVSCLVCHMLVFAAGMRSRLQRRLAAPAFSHLCLRF